MPYVYKGNPRNTSVRLPNLKTKKTKGRKRPIKCQDGPLIGHTLWLTESETAVFTIKGQTGQYKEGKWNASA